jgi:hypothetical protein
MKRLYILVRCNLRRSSPAVQACHAVANFCLNGNGGEWNNQTLIYLGVRSLRELKNWKFKLDMKNIEYFEFKEPDMNNELTAIAVLLEDGKIFRKLRLLK